MALQAMQRRNNVSHNIKNIISTVRFHSTPVRVFCVKKKALYPEPRHQHGLTVDDIEAGNAPNGFKTATTARRPIELIPWRKVRLPPEVNRVLYIRNLPYKITSDEMYDIFGKYGAIRQIRVGNTPETRGTAFVVYEDIFDAKNACDHLSGFNVCNRYLVVLYYQSNKAFKRLDIDKKQEELDKIKTKYNINSDDLRK